MRNSPRHPCNQTYALRLRAQAADPTRLLGEIEHVVGGECLDFDSAEALLAALARLQAQVLADAGADTPRAGAAVD